MILDLEDKKRIDETLNSFKEIHIKLSSLEESMQITQEKFKQSVEKHNEEWNLIQENLKLEREKSNILIKSISTKCNSTVDEVAKYIFKNYTKINE